MELSEQRNTGDIVGDNRRGSGRLATHLQARKTRRVKMTSVNSDDTSRL